MQSIKLNSTITCPECGHNKTEKMPTNACGSMNVNHAKHY